MRLNVGDRVKNRFRQDSEFNYTQFGVIVGFAGCLMKVKIDGRSYEGLTTEYSWCVPSDWILA